MLILQRTTHGKLTPIGVPVTNIAEVSPHEDGGCWVKYWNGTEIRTMVVNESLDEIQHKTFIAKGHE